MNTDSPVQNPGTPEPHNPRRLIATFLRLLVKLYRNTIGLTLPNSCRYQPTCSQYALDALGEYGAVKGIWLTLKRVARCHPWAAGRYDPVPPNVDCRLSKDECRSPGFRTERRTTSA